MNIFLVRHGESQANIDKNIYRTVADHNVSLSDKGIEQAQNAGIALDEYILNKHIEGNFRLWNSPYKRTRQTADEIYKILSKRCCIDRREHINLCEQQFGLFDGLEDCELAIKFPNEYEHYKKCEDHEGRFWARMPLGESRFDVAVRVHEAFGTFRRDADLHDIKNIIVICHGVTMRAFIMQWLHYPVEWFEKEKNPHNCAIRLISSNKDLGYIF